MDAKSVVWVLLGIFFLNMELQERPPQKAQKKPPGQTLPSYTFPTLLLTTDDGKEMKKIQKFIMSFKQPEEFAAELATYIVMFARNEEMDPKLLSALVARESGFNPKAVSKSGALGLGQLLPGTAKEVGVEDPFEPKQNLEGTARYFKKMMNFWKGHPKQIEMALASYRVGYGVVKKYKDVPDIPEVLDFISGIGKYYETLLKYAAD